MPSKPTLVFDFDGTIVDTLMVYWQIYNQLAQKFNYSQIKKEEIDQYRSMEVKQVCNALNIPWLAIPKLLKEGKKELRSYPSKLKPIKGIIPIFEQLKAGGYQLGILSSSPRESITLFLNNHQLDVFDFVYITSNLFSKARTINKMLKQQRLNRQAVVYIGDEIRDIKAARQADVVIIAVSWGFNTVQALNQAAPNFLITKPKQLLTAINNI